MTKETHVFHDIVKPVCVEKIKSFLWPLKAKKHLHFFGTVVALLPSHSVCRYSTGCTVRTGGPFCRAWLQKGFPSAEGIGRDAGGFAWLDFTSAEIPQGRTAQFSTARPYAPQESIAEQHSKAQRSSVLTQYSPAHHSTAQHHRMRRIRVRYNTIEYDTSRYDIGNWRRKNAVQHIRKIQKKHH